MNKRFLSPCNPAVLAAALLAAGCLPLSADSLWKASSSKSMTADRRARRAGDIITILVQENNSAQKDNSTSTSKKSGLDASVSSFLYPPSASGLLTKKGALPAMKMDSSSSFDGSGKVNNTEAITGRIAVRVIDVLPNGNLVLEGTRRTTFSGETTDAILHGVVRSDDVTAANTVYSYNVADATVRYQSKGVASDAQSKGWFSRTWDKVSPF
jgi:flagellar L-ring protein precursor FlgH